MGVFNDKLSLTKSFWGISIMIYDRPSEMVAEQFFGLYFFFNLHGSKTYSGIGIQYATCQIQISTSLNIPC